MRRAVVAGCLALLLAGVACGGSDDGAGTAPLGTPTQTEAPAPGGASSPGGVGDAIGLDLQVPALETRIVKNASVTLEVKDGTFDQRFQQATLIAGSQAGFVSSSRSGCWWHWRWGCTD